MNLHYDRRPFLSGAAPKVAAAKLRFPDLLALFSAPAPATPAADGALTALDNASEWLNSPPLTAAGLRGKVVLIDFWTYTCINWLRTLPYLRAWHRQYQAQGLVLVGVHAPEFSFEHDLGNVQRAIQELGVDFPVAIDNDFGIWRAFDNQYWPAVYLLDGQGRIRHQQFGEGNYHSLGPKIQELLQETGRNSSVEQPLPVVARGIEAAADWGNLQSWETYVGHSHAKRFASPEGKHLGEPYPYTAPAQLAPNHWALSGTWTMEPGAAQLNAPHGGISFRFHARDLHLVMGTAVPDTPARFRVSLDGQPPGSGHGLDVDDQGNGTVTYPRLYQLIRQPETGSDHQFGVEFLDAGVKVFAFTFG
ncbi:redoxin domain-containing protein [Hymenobacter sp. 15J16-1T3B]|uniref:redoxin domain-containing protein n=1 Tax=Hymenobacter sp. 15J16-1T3B TaxID=2886941 RepID=UPI001D12B0A4|nr:redoxin domain-containing protein [Hymenobacter sp. 15J16-1T3B]MCC3158438.1 redoxin domain-containing protein [Hymenobacter sp. 15J16-1T3B]